MAHLRLSPEEALNELESYKQQTLYLRSILESPQGIIIFSLDTKYHYTSFAKVHAQTMKEIWGASIDIGTSILDVISNETDRQKAQNNFDAALSGMYLLMEEEYGDVNLKRTFWENRYSPIYNDEGTIIGVTVFVTDISDRKRMEIDLRNSEQFKLAIINSLPANIAVIDQDGIILSVNDRWKQFHAAGHAMDQSSMDIGASYLEACQKAIPVKSNRDDSARKSLDGIKDVLEGRRSFFSMDYPCHAPDRKQWFLMTATKLPHDLKGAVISHVDITELKKVEEERRDFTRHLLDATEKERIRIARELHDAIGQALTLLSFDVIRTQQETPEQCEGILQNLSGMNESLQGMVTTIQRICTNLRPVLLDDIGLAAAVEWKCEEFSRRSGISCNVDWKGGDCGNPRCATELFRIVQESLNNIGKYAHATSVQINFTKNRRFNKLEIKDNGFGFKADLVPFGSGFGIVGMRERALSLGATFSIKSEVKRGTVITILIPCGKKESCCEDPHC